MSTEIINAPAPMMNGVSKTKLKNGLRPQPRYQAPPHRGYLVPEKAKVDRALYARMSESGWSNVVEKLTVPKQKAISWVLKAGQSCRIFTENGQVGDVNFWNLHNPKERFFSGKTRQIHRTHLTQYDRLWSNMPWLRPIATITQDTLSWYGVDEYNCSVHDVIGTRCDPYLERLVTGELGAKSCHQNIVESVVPWGLQELDVHDVFNIFMCTGYSPEHEYIIRASPAVKGDYIEWIAEMDLLISLSACPCGDVSIIIGDEDTMPEEICFPMDVYIGQPSEDLIEEWKKTKVL